MFKVELNAAGVLIKIVDIIAAIVDVATIKASKTGISMRSIDPAHVALLDLILPKEFFASYQCDTPIPLRINVTDFNRFMKRGTATDAVTLELDTAVNKLKIKFKHGKSHRTFSIGLIAEMDDEEPKFPQIQYKANFQVDPDEFGRGVKDAEVVGDYVTLIAEDNKLKLSASGDNGDVDIEMEEFKEPPKIEDKQTALYSIEYLKDIVKASGLSNVVGVHFTTEMPLQIDVPLDKKGCLTFVLAPRSMEEDTEGGVIEEAESTVTAENEGTEESEEVDEASGEE